MIFEICAIVATLMLILLTIYIIQTLREVQKSLKTMSKTLSGLELELAVLQVDLNKLLCSSTELVQKANEKISDLDPLFQIVHHAGNALNARSQSFFRKERTQPSEEVETKDMSENFLDIIDLAKVGIKLYQQIKKRK